MLGGYIVSCLHWMWCLERHYRILLCKSSGEINIGVLPDVAEQFPSDRLACKGEHINRAPGVKDFFRQCKDSKTLFHLQFARNITRKTATINRYKSGLHDFRLRKNVTVTHSLGKLHLLASDRFQRHVNMTIDLYDLNDYSIDHIMAYNMDFGPKVCSKTPSISATLTLTSPLR